MHVYFLHNKYKVLDTFKVFKDEVEKQCEMQIMIVKTDIGNKYYLRFTEDGQAMGLFVKFLQGDVIVAQYSMLGFPDQNGVLERRNRALMDMVRSV